MSVQDDLLNEEKYVLNQSLHEAPENTQMCSFWQDETEDMCSFRQDFACGDHSCTTSERYVKILDFRHFERHFMFSQGDRKIEEKSNFGWCERVGGS